MECSKRGPPPDWAGSERQEEWPGTTDPVGQNWSSRSMYPSGAPKVPSAITSRSQEYTGLKRDWNPTWATTPDVTTASTRETTSSNEDASGFSHMMALPAARAARMA